MKLHPCFLLPYFCSVLFGQEVASPSGNLNVMVTLEGGKLNYTVTQKGRTVIDPSPLGLETSIGSFAQDLVAGEHKVSAIDESYTLPQGKQREIHHRAQQLDAAFTTKEGNRLDLKVRVSDRDVGIAYTLSSKDKTRVVIRSERTGFKLPKGTTAYRSPQVPWGEGFAGTKPSYEEAYQVDVAAGAPSPRGLGFTFPALFRLGSDGWVLISETGVTSHYVGSRLGEPTAEGLYPIAFPEAAENAGIGDATVYGSLPFTTPWRTLTIGETLAPIIETTVATDLVKPLYPASHDYKPGRSAWSWLVWQDASMNMADQTKFVDLAAEMGFEYLLVDALWDQNLGRDGLAKLVADAKKKGVEILLWYNSNGAWNDAPQSPRNRMDSAPARREEMKWLQSIGVRGMKVDFFGGDKQVTMKLYEDILTEADAHGLMLNFHGATLPRGWERLYPNFMTSEAVTASENLIFSQGFADAEAYNSTLYPFIRNGFAPMDYGPMVLNKRFARDPNKGNVRRTTDAFQLATAVTYFSPLQHFGLTPENLKDQPAYVLDFLRKVPAVWDEVRFIDGYPGKHVVLARRSGERWYVGATNGEKQAKELTLNLPFLKGKTLKLIHDKADRTAGEKTVTVGADGKVTLQLEGQGGAVLFN